MLLGILLRYLAKQKALAAADDEPQIVSHEGFALVQVGSNAYLPGLYCVCCECRRPT